MRAWDCGSVIIAGTAVPRWRYATRLLWHMRSVPVDVLRLAGAMQQGGRCLSFFMWAFVMDSPGLGRIELNVLNVDRRYSI